MVSSCSVRVDRQGLPFILALNRYDSFLHPNEPVWSHTRREYEEVGVDKSIFSYLERQEWSDNITISGRPEHPSYPSFGAALPQSDQDGVLVSRGSLGSTVVVLIRS